MRGSLRTSTYALAAAFVAAGLLAGCESVVLPSPHPHTDFSTVNNSTGTNGPDADNDGEPDASDNCPRTPAGESADSAGCSCSQRDTDGDGVNDCLDECPFNAAVAKTGAAISFVVTFDDPAGQYAQYYAPLRATVEAAGADWARNLLAAADVSIEIEIQFGDIATAHGGSSVSALVGRENGVDIYEQGVATEIRTGRDPNGDAPDATITVGTRNLTDGAWWFDPEPTARTAAIPADKLDAYSTILHEIGHVLAYNGWRNQEDGSMPGAYQSTYDQYQLYDGDDFYFNGPQANFVYGGPVPLTHGNICHVANRAPRPGDDLLDELMNGVADHRGWRRFISGIDRAILADVGLPVRLAGGAAAGCDTQLLGQPAARHLPAILGPATTPQEAGGAGPALRNAPQAD